MAQEGDLESGREHGPAILLPFAAPHHDLLAIEVDVLDPKLQHLHQPETAGVDERGGEGGRAAHAFEDRRDFRWREDHGDALGQLGSGCPLQAFQFAAEDGAIEEQDGAESLILGGRRDAKARGQGFEESRDLGLGHGVGVAPAVENDKAADPEDVGLLGARRVVTGTDGLAHSIQQAGLGGGNGLEFVFRHDGSNGSRERPRWYPRPASVRVPSVSVGSKGAQLATLALPSSRDAAVDAPPR